MIRLITGTPGSGKTLYVVSQIMEIRASHPDRQIFTDIKGIRIDGVNDTAPDDWRDAPDGSLIIYDECQYREQYTKSRGRNRYQMIIDLTTHRHTGKDIWLITQNPNFLHADVLAVVGEHYHIDRPMKANFANVYKWRNAQLKPDGVTVRRRAETAPIFKYDKKLFDYYDSVDVDDSKANHKNSWAILKNWRVLVLLGGVILCGWAFYSIAFDGGIAPPQKEQEKKEQESVSQDKNDIADIVVGGAKQQEPQLTEELLKEKLKLQEEQFKFELHKQRTQLLLDYENLKKQLIEQDKQMKDFYRQLELMRTMLPKDYEVLKSTPDLQVRGVAKFGNKCKAYNTQGMLMTLTKEQCDYYLQESGRVWKNPNANTVSTPAPVSAPAPQSQPQPNYPPSLVDNSTVTPLPLPTNASSGTQSHVNTSTEHGGNLNEQ